MDHNNNTNHCYSSLFDDRTAPRLCSLLLPDPWPSAYNEDEIECSPIKIGRSNQLFVCKLVGKSASDYYDHACPAKVIVRFYGSEHTGKGNRYKSISDETEIQILNHLSQQKMAPKVYAAFDGGRIEEFIESTLMTVDRLKSVPMIIMVAQKTAQFHAMDAILLKDAKLFKFFLNYRKDVNQKVDSMKDIVFPDKRHSLLWFEIKDFVQNTRFNDLLNACKKTFKKKVFAHLDLNFTNFLILNDNHNQSNHECHQSKCDNHNSIDVMLIDIENSMYAYRAADVGKFFAELAISDDDSLHKSIPDHLIKTFCMSYLQKWRTIGAPYDPKIDNLTYFVKEVKLGALFHLLCHLFWNVLHPNFTNLELLENTVRRIRLFEHLSARWPLPK